MTVLLLSVVVVTLAFAGLSLGVIFGRRPIEGACGGPGCRACAGSCRDKRHEVPDAPAEDDG